MNTVMASLDGDIKGQLFLPACEMLVSHYNIFKMYLIYFNVIE